MKYVANEDGDCKVWVQYFNKMLLILRYRATHPSLENLSKFIIIKCLTSVKIPVLFLYLDYYPDLSRNIEKR